MTPAQHDEMNSIRWWHSIEVEPGVFTDGYKKNLSAEATRLYGMPQTLEGKSVLDIGGWDGGYAFEAEKRGASRVLMTDINQNKSVAVPNKGFFFAKNILKSNVEFLPLDVMDLSPESVGMFDVVLYYGVMYHIDNMFGALKAISSVTNEECIIETAIIADPAMQDIKLPLSQWGLNRNGDIHNRWFPNVACVVQLGLDAGFRETRIHYKDQGRVVVRMLK